MQVLVTGCAGFIGSQLCERLLDDGHQVTGVDCLTDYYDPAIKRRNLEICRRSANFQFLYRPIAQLPGTMVREAEWIFHLAARPSVRSSWSDEFPSYVSHNILNTQHLLECVRDSSNLQRFVYASSSSVYGNSGETRLSEQDVAVPFSPYGMTKLAAENLCSLYGENFGVPTVSLRLFTVCGPRQRPDMLLSRLISAAVDNERFCLYGNGNARRDFTSVADIVEAMLLAARRSSRFRVFNISGGAVASVSEVIQMVEEEVGKRIRVEIASPQVGDVKCTRADLTRAHAELGYVPSWGLADTIRAQVRAASRCEAPQAAVA